VTQVTKVESQVTKVESSELQVMKFCESSHMV